MPGDQRSYWDIATVAVEAEPFAPLPPAQGPPPQIDKPDLPLVAIIKDDEEVDAPERGGPTFVGAGPVTAPVGPPGLSADHSEVAPTTKAPGAFMAAWSMSAKAKLQKSQLAQRRRKRALRALMLLVVGIAAYFAYPFVHTKIVARSVSADLRSYVEGKGVAHAPKGGGYLVRLPKVPTHSNPQLVAPTIPMTIATRGSIVTGRDYKIVVLVGDLPGGVLPKGLRHALADPKIGGIGTLTGVRQTELAGETAFTGTFLSSDALPRRVAVVVHDGRLYVIRVQAQSVGTVFDTLTKSFRFALPR